MQIKPIYKSLAGEQAIQNYYTSILEKWPVPCKKIKIPTRHGETFMIASGPPAAPQMLLLHGSSTNSAMWLADVIQYSRHFRVYAVDTLGEPGRSAQIRPSLKSHAYAEWLAEIFETLKIGQAVLVGCSQGGWLALRFATLHPTCVVKLVLLAPGGVSQVRIGMILRVAALSFLGRRGAESIKRIVFDDLKMPEQVAVFSELIEKHYNPRTDPQPLFTDIELQRLTMPTLLIAGENDCFYRSQNTAARLEKLLPNFTAEILADTGHVLLHTTKAVLSFLDKSNL